MAQPTMPPIVIDPNQYALSNISILFDDEQFLFQIASGNQLRNFIASPKHAKRIMLLLQKQVEAYEKKNGELKTELMQKKSQTSETDKKMGF